MLKELRDIGLSEKEAKVYLSSLEIGRATADQLAKHSKIVRSTTYVQIESLMKKGLMSTYEEGKKTFFAPESPEYLKRIFDLKRKEFEAKESELQSFLPELIRKFEGAGERPVVRFFSGKEGVTAMRDEALNDLKKGDSLLVMYSYDELFKFYAKEEIYSFSEKREKKGINLKIIYSRIAGKLPLDTRGTNSERRFMPVEKFSLETDIFIFGDKVGLMALRGAVFGVVVESGAIANTMRKLFDISWESAEEEG